MEDDEGPPRPDSLLPYDTWTEDALRQVVARALAYAGANGLPGEHHFYISFRTDRPGVVIPARLLAQYPHEMTIVVQHQFWDLVVAEESFSIGLSFGGIPSTLTVPFRHLTAFADPHVQFGLRFTPAAEDAANDGAPQPPPGPGPAPEGGDGQDAGADEGPQVVSLDAFRKRPTTKE